VPQLPEPTRLFEAKVRDCITAAAAVLDEEATLQDAWDRARNLRGTLAVVAGNGRLIGSFAAADVLDWLARGVKPTDRIARLLGDRRHVVDADRHLLDAVVAMRRERLPALAVTDARGRFLGLVTLTDVLHAGATPAFEVAAMLSGERSVEALGRIAASEPEIAARMLATHVPEEQILATLSDINAELHRRALDIALADLAADGWGQPPVPFAFAVMGSGGRRENLIGPDQDNALVIADHDEAERRATESYFIALAERLTRTLDRIGFELCKGNVMATNPVWRKSLAEWREQISIWASRRQPIHLLNSDVMLDVAHVAGDETLVCDLRRHMLAEMRRSPAFVRDLYGIEQDHTVALNWFGFLKRETSEHEEPGVINLKMRGTLPLVEGARLLSLIAGIDATSTSRRLAALAEAGKLQKDEVENLLDCFRTLVGMILAQQIEDARARRPITDYVVHEKLSARDKTRLRRALREIERFRTELPVRIGVA
jgi:signal-transduction protein with cAMP-binding, CBS, and nucleotidyltransferase domain